MATSDVLILAALATLGPLMSVFMIIFLVWAVVYGFPMMARDARRWWVEQTSEHIDV